MFSALREASRRGALHRPTDPAAVDALLDVSMSTDWVVYPKPCMNHNSRVVEYSARYSNHLAISDARIDGIDEEYVAFREKGYRDESCDKVLVLEG